MAHSRSNQLVVPLPTPVSLALKFHHLPMLVPHELLQLFNRPALHVTQPRGCLLDAIAINHNARSEMWGHDGDDQGRPWHHPARWSGDLRLPSAVSDLS